MRDIKKYTQQYFESFPEDYKADPKNMEKIKQNINYYIISI